MRSAEEIANAGVVVEDLALSLADEAVKALRAEALVGVSIGIT